MQGRSAIPPRRSAVQSQLLARRQVQQQQVDTEEEDYPDMPRMPTSTRRYYDTRGNEVIQQGNRRLVIHYDEPPPKKHRVHWMLILGIGMMLMLWLYIGFSWAANWWTNRQLDATYGFPRTYQVDAVVGHSDSVAHPSHFIFLNLNGHIEIIELPGGDATNAKIYIGPTLFSDNAPFVPVTGEFRNVGGKEEMIIHIQDQHIIYVSNGTKFVLKP
jgi:hypothetical protein